MYKIYVCVCVRLYLCLNGNKYSRCQEKKRRRRFAISFTVGCLVWLARLIDNIANIDSTLDALMLIAILHECEIKAVNSVKR